ncbi:polysaccharide deacetylase family protein [Leifsonia sp. NPDC056665]|uniref:polysaccharide deacetylase family protein n=1 Tax=Leifsonia sp. NPDC056665 TaxID=3345901 RepID=UPI0036C61EBD
MPNVPWPDGITLPISLVVNIEEGSERTHADGDPDQETMTEWATYPLPPDIRNLAMESMYEYGSRVGVWRIFDAIAERGLTATMFACAVALERAPEVVAAIKEHGFGVVCHGYRWEEVFRLSPEEERQHIRDAVESMTRTLGAPPRGWYCRYGPSANTRRLLVEEGFEYDCDAYNDDLPYFVPVDGVRHLVVPYSPDNNDLRFWQSPGMVHANDFFLYLKDSFDVLYREGSDRTRMMSIGLHSRVVGRPGRIAGLTRFLDYARQFGGVEFVTRDWIVDHWRTAGAEHA